MRVWASEPAHPSMAGATVVSGGPVVIVSLSCLSPEVVSGFWWAVAVVSPGFRPRSREAFSCLLAFSHPSPVVGRQGGKTNNLALLLGIPPRMFGASTEIGHPGARDPGRTPWHR